MADPQSGSNLNKQSAAEFLAQRLSSAQPYSSKEDPPVWYSGYWETPTSPEGTASGAPQFVNRPGQKPKSQADLDFERLDDTELRRFQELAFQAGYYGPSAERSDIPFGAKDPETFKIWQQYNDRAANRLKVGKQHTLWDILEEDVRNRPENANQNKKRAPLITQLPDPREIEEMVRGVAPSVIGRDADAAFTQDFIAMYTKIVSEFQANKYALEETGGTITAPPSAEALAAFRLRTENPEQFEEKRSAARAAAYTQLLKGAL